MIILLSGFSRGNSPSPHRKVEGTSLQLRKSHHKNGAGGPGRNEKVWVCYTGTCYRLRTESAVTSAGEKKKGTEKERGKKKKDEDDYLCTSWSLMRRADASVVAPRACARANVCSCLR